MSIINFFIISLVYAIAMKLQSGAQTRGMYLAMFVCLDCHGHCNAATKNARDGQPSQQLVCNVSFVIPY